jgi:uncharacterized protein
VTINKKYTFSDPVLGTLDLELDNPLKQVFQDSIPNDFKWESYGLKPEGLNDDESLYFFEWQKIHYSFVGNSSAALKGPVEIRVNDRVLKRSFEKNGVIILSGYFSFEDAVGDTKIEIADANNKLIFKLITEVFPQKMDYRSDFKTMVAEISQIIQNLTYDTLKDTFQKSKARSSGQSTDSEWWNILDGLFEYLIINLGVIKRQAKHEIATSEVVYPVEKIRQATKQQTDWFRKNKKFSNKAANGIMVGKDYFTHAQSMKKFVTYDTWENRFIAWAVKGLVEKLRKYAKNVESRTVKNDKSPYSPILKRIKKYQGRLQGILHDTPFNEVSPFEKRAHFSTSLTRGAGYRDFMHIYLLLTRGLELAENEIFKIEQKNISTLYEYWCFLKLVQLTKELHNYEVSYQDLIRINANRVQVKLKTGKSSKIEFRKKDSEETTTIHYNKEFRRDNKKVFTYDQVPDYSISFKKDGFKKPFWYLFDAKYRFDEKVQQDQKAFDAPQDAIGQLHRYRDAILHSEPTNSTYRSAIKNLGGVILYPYPFSEDSFRNNTFYKSLKDVNIGALPFLPSKTTLVNEFLKELINKPPSAHFEEVIEMDRSEYEEHRNSWKEWVTIDVIKKKNQKERLEFLNKTHLHHIPFIKNTHSKVYLTNHLLLCQSGTKKAFLFEVEAREIFSQKKLKEFGANWNLGSSQYISFKLKNKKEIETPKPIAQISFRYSSLKGLLTFLENVPIDENYFYLTNPDGARLYEELKLNGRTCSINWIDKPNDPSFIRFNLEGLAVFSSDSFPNLHFQFNNKLLHLSELRKELSLKT